MATDFYKSGSSYYTSTGTKIKDLNELQTLAKAGGKEIKAPSIPAGSTAIPNPSAIPNYNVTANIGGTLYGTQKTPAAPVVPTVPSQLNVEQLSGKEQFKPAEIPVDTTDAFVKSLGIQNQSIADFISEQRKQSQAEIEKQQGLINQFGDISSKLSTKGTRLTQEQEKLGIPGLTTQLSDLNTRIATISAEYDKLIDRTGALPFSVTGVSGEVGRATRAKAVEIGGLSAIAQALQGNIETARQTATDTINKEFQPLRNQIEALQTQISQNYNLMSVSEKRRADELNTVYEAQKTEIAKQEEQKKQIYNTMITAAQNGADNSTLNNIRNAKTEEEAVLMATGATPINTPAELKGLTENDIIRVGNKIYKKGAKNFLAENTGKYEIKETEDGRLISFNSQTGKWEDIKITSGGNTFTPATTEQGVMRTDRNNNPTAMTTDVAKTLGLVEGVDYERGDKFPGSSNLYTAKLLGNAVATTIKALDTAATAKDKQAFYTLSGNPRWSYIAMSDDEWLSKTQEQKKQIIATMYQNEGGSGELIDTITTPQADEVVSLTKLVESGELTVEKALSQVSDKNREALQKSLSQIKTKSYQNAQETKIMALDLINALKKDAASTWAVGWTSPLANIKGTKMYDYKTNYDSLRDLLALGNIDKLKGAMSDKDIEFLRNSASSLKLGTTKDEFIKRLNQLEFRLNNPTSSISEMTNEDNNPLGIDMGDNDPLGLGL